MEYYKELHIQLLKTRSTTVLSKNKYYNIIMEPLLKVKPMQAVWLVRNNYELYMENKNDLWTSKAFIFREVGFIDDL